jgi:hypothetical protein
LLFVACVLATGFAATGFVVLAAGFPEIRGVEGGWINGFSVV